MSIKSYYQLIKNIFIIVSCIGLYSCASTSSEDAYDQGLDALRQDDYTLAIQKFTEYLQQNPDHFLASSAHFKLASLNLAGLGGKQNINQAVKHLEKTRFRREDEAKHLLADLYLSGIGVTQDVDKAIKLYKSSEFKRAKLDLAMLYWQGIQVNEDPEEAKRLTQEVIDSMYDSMQLKSLFVHSLRDRCNAAYDTLVELGKGICFSEFELETFEHAQNIWEKRDPNNNDYAVDLISVLYLSIANKNSHTPIAFYQWAAEHGDALSQRTMGILYLDNPQIEHAQDIALGWFTKAAEQGDPEAAYYLGDLSLSQAKSDGNYQPAIKWLSIAAKAGHEHAVLALADIYLYPPEELERDISQGFMWLKLGTHRGDPKAKHRLADAYFNPDYQMQDKQLTAMQMYKELFNQDGDNKAAFHLGMNYARGNGAVERDSEEAKYWFKQAAYADYIPAKISLAYYLEGSSDGLRWRKEVISLDTSELTRRQRKEVNDLRHRHASYCLNLATPDTEQAIHVLSLAAEGGDLKAYTRLGLLYYKGNEDIATNPEQAFFWLAKWRKEIDYLVENDPAEYLLNLKKYSNEEADAAYEDLRYLELTL